MQDGSKAKEVSEQGCNEEIRKDMVRQTCKSGNKDKAGKSAGIPDSSVRM